PNEHEAARHEDPDQRQVVEDEFAHGIGRASKARGAGKKGQFYPINPCRSQSAGRPTAMGAMGWRIRVATARATRPASHRGFASVRSKAPSGIARPGATMAASTAGGTKARACLKSFGNFCGS